MSRDFRSGDVWEEIDGDFSFLIEADVDGLWYVHAYYINSIDGSWDENWGIVRSEQQLKKLVYRQFEDKTPYQQASDALDSWLNRAVPLQDRINTMAEGLEYAAFKPRWVTEDSGTREVRPSGMMRDTEKGKARFDLLVPEGVPYEFQFLTRVAELLARGAEKYEARNWEKADDSEALGRFKSSAFRHLMQWMAGDGYEDHAAAVVFNLLAHETTLFKVGLKAIDKLNSKGTE